MREKIDTLWVDTSQAISMPSAAFVSLNRQALLVAVALFAGQEAVWRVNSSHACVDPQSPYDRLICLANLFVEDSRKPTTSFQDVLCTVEGKMHSGDIVWCKVRSEQANII